MAWCNRKANVTFYHFRITPLFAIKNFVNILFLNISNSQILKKYLIILKFFKIKSDIIISLIAYRYNIQLVLIPKY